MPDPVETLYVNIEGNFSGLLDDLEEAVKRVESRLDDLEGASQESGQQVGNSATKAGFAFGLAAGAATKLLDIVVGLAQKIPQMFAALAKEAISANAQFETFATQFETLLGSGALARERLEELAQFGVETPFELPEIVEASRTLQTFGGTTLATGDNLRMIGDIAAGVNQPFQSVAFWIGRMYDAMQNGQPFGEASARLQEMGALTGDTRRQLEAMQKTGADGAEIFAVFSDEVGGRFTGNMERLSQTFQGVTSNLADFRGNLLRVGGEPLFEAVRQSAIDFLEVLDANAPALEEIARGIGEIAGMVVEFARVELFGNLDLSGPLESIKTFIEWIKAVLKPLLALAAEVKRFVISLEPLGKAIIFILAVFTPLGRAISLLVLLLPRLDEALLTASKGLAIITATIEGLKVSALGAIKTIVGMGKALFYLATGNIPALKDALLEANDGIKQVTQGGAEAFKKSILDSAKSIDERMNPAVKDLTENIETLGDVAGDTGDKLAPLLDPAKIDQFSDQLIDAVERRDEQLQALEESHAEKINGILSDANEKRLDIEDKFGKDQAKLAGESEKARLKVIDDTRGKLAELAEETDRDLAARRKDFNKNELRETEDHLKDMRRLQEDYLTNLEDAVRDRDAGAIVDLQRKFNLERSRKEEDFQTGQSRTKKDFSEELSAIRQNEKDKREEILAAQARELEDIRVNEEEKKLELEMRRQEDLDKLGQNLQEKLQKENENYAERQMALDAALQKQLEAIAKNLADEKDVTEEGAREILETFDKYFGIGGDIDQLMENFSRRRRIRAEIQVEFEAEPPPPASGTGKATGGGSFGGRIGGVSEFAAGGTLIATKPTLAMFGEAGPEVVQFTPMSQLSSPGGQEPGRMVIEMTGSAPPGIGAGERDQIAAVLLTALQETGALG